jgi:hypothetical protein
VLVRPRSLALPATHTTITKGTLTTGQSLAITSESDQLIIFGDGSPDLAADPWGGGNWSGLPSRG